MTLAPTRPLLSGAQIPLLGLGTYPLKDDEAATAVAAGIEAGYRLIDTASKYENEAAVGRGIRDSGIDPDELFVTTKLRGADHGADKVRSAVEQSLERLGLDRVDLFLIHWPVPRVGRFVESYAALLEQRDAGLIGSVGVSNFKAHHIEALAKEIEEPPALNQIQLCPAIARTELRHWLDDHDIVAQAWSPLGIDEGVPDESVVTSIAGELGRTPGQVILRWHVQQGIVAIPKSADPVRQQQNIDVFGFELSTEQMTALYGLDRGEGAAVDSDEHEEF